MYFVHLVFFVLWVLTCLGTKAVGLVVLRQWLLAWLLSEMIVGRLANWGHASRSSIGAGRGRLQSLSSDAVALLWWFGGEVCGSEVQGSSESRCLLVYNTISCSLVTILLISSCRVGWWEDLPCQTFDKSAVDSGNPL